MQVKGNTLIYNFTTKFNTKNCKSNIKTKFHEKTRDIY